MRTDNFQEVDAGLVKRSTWRVVRCGRWRREEPINRLEGRALVAALERSAVTRLGSRQRRLFLVDNLAVALCFERGRAKSHAMLRLVRRWGALCLARDVRASVRWMRSETNPADLPSRPLEPKAFSAPALEGR